MAPKNGYNKANYQKNTNLVKSATFVGQHPSVSRVKTDGRIGSATPPRFLKGGFDVVSDTGIQAHKGGLGAAAAKHMSTADVGEVWSPRVKKARAMAKPNPKPYANPVNVNRPSLKKVRPD